MDLKQLIIIVAFAGACVLWFVVQQLCQRCDPAGKHERPRVGCRGSHHHD